jgi:hypothetical protein
MEGAQKINPPSDFADVTLAKPEQTFCKYHNSGHCKFGENCRHYHTKYTCSNIQCDEPSCTNRHPKPCNYFLRFGACKFGSKCSYRHNTNTSDDEFKTLQSEITNIKETLKDVLSALKDKENKIKVFEQRIACLEGKSKVSGGETYKCNESKELENFKCNYCDYVAVSGTALKSHVTKKHKLETLRSMGSDVDSRRLSPEKDTLREEPMALLSEDPGPLLTLRKQGALEACGICHELFDENDFKFHMNEIFEGRACSLMPVKATSRIIPLYIHVLNLLPSAFAENHNIGC